MKLYHFPPAPNPAKVLVFLEEKGITDIELLLVNFLEGEQRSEPFLERSPRGVVPVLELDDGTCVTESLPIMEYLEEVYPEPVLIGATARERLRVRSLERYIELNVTNRLVRLVHSTNSPLGLPANPVVAETEQTQLRNVLPYVDERVGAGPFVMGERPTIADCTLLAGFNFARFGGVTLLDEGYENLKRWFENFALRHL